jgi:uncharacterized linocin/CFP29 family protein
VNHLLRELAPISDPGWEAIEAEAKQALGTYLVARKLVDFTGPRGWTKSSVRTGRVSAVKSAPAGGVSALLRTAQPLVELRTDFDVPRAELDAIDRGTESPDLDVVVDAAKRLAEAEDRAIFRGFSAGEIIGIAEATPHDPVAIPDDYEDYPRPVAKAVAVLRQAGVDGPYGIALGPRCYTGVIETTQRGGYPVLEHLRLILGGPVIWAPAVDGAIVVSLRGGDFELISGQDASIGYASATTDSVSLFLQESLTFRAHGPEAAIALTYERPAKGRKT